MAYGSSSLKKFRQRALAPDYSALTIGQCQWVLTVDFQDSLLHQPAKLLATWQLHISEQPLSFEHCLIAIKFMINLLSKSSQQTWVPGYFSRHSALQQLGAFRSDNSTGGLEVGRPTRAVSTILNSCEAGDCANSSCEDFREYNDTKSFIVVRKLTFVTFSITNVFHSTIAIGERSSTSIATCDHHSAISGQLSTLRMINLPFVHADDEGVW
jgi:hypothetical protein